MYLIRCQWFRLILSLLQIIIRFKQKLHLQAEFRLVRIPEFASSDLFSVWSVFNKAQCSGSMGAVSYRHRLKSHFLLITCMILTNPRKANMPSPHSLFLMGLPLVQLLLFGPCWKLCRHFACQFLYALGEVIKVQRKFRNLIHTILLFVGWARAQARVISIHIYCMAPFLQIDTHWQPHTHMMRDLCIAAIYHLSFPYNKLNTVTPSIWNCFLVSGVTLIPAIKQEYVT